MFESALTGPPFFSLFCTTPRPAVRCTITMPNAVTHTASTVKESQPKPFNIAVTRKKQSKVKLLSLPDRALYLIIEHMRFPSFSTSSQKKDHGKEEPEPVKTEIKECRHSFIRPAFNLAQTCTRLYTLYRSRMLSPHFFGKGYLLSLNCDPGYCLTPMLKRLRALKIIGDSPFADMYRCEFIVSERLYSRGVVDNRPIQAVERHVQRRLIRNEFILNEDQVLPFFRVAWNFREVRRLHLADCPAAFKEDIWKLIADAWRAVLSELIVQDVFMMFEGSVLEDVRRMKGLCSVQVMSPAVMSATPFLHHGLLRHLDLSCCTLYDEDIEPLLFNLTVLEHLDLSDTYVTPEIAQILPGTLTAFAAGEKNVHSHPPLVDGFSDNPFSNCFCFAYTGKEDGHTETCETEKPNGDNPRWNTKNYAFLRPDRLPFLQELKWGHWGDFAQGIGSLSGVISSLRSLTLSGRDYDDEVSQFLLCATRLARLELLGCDITDDTAYVISRMANLDSVDVSNCTRVTSVGLFAIADGRPAREGRLRGIRTNAYNEPIAPGILRNDLLVNEITRMEILNKFKLR